MSLGSKVLLIVILLLVVHIVYVLSQAIGLDQGGHTSALPWPSGNAGMIGFHAFIEMLIALVLTIWFAVVLLRSDDR